MSISLPRRGKKFLPKIPDAEPELRRAIDTIPQLVWSAFPDGSVEFCNRRWLEYTGLTAEQAQGWGWRAAIHPEDLDELVATWRRVLAKGVPSEAEARMRNADGTFHWFLIRARPQRDEQGRIVKWYGTNTDIDERKRAEKALEETEHRFRLIADTAPVLIWMSGTDKLCTYFNKPWLDFTGRSVDLELGNGWAEGVHTEDLRRCMDTYTQAFDRREEFRTEYRLRRHDGEYRWVLDIGVPRFNQDRSFAGYIGSCVDVTDRKLAERELGSANERLHLAMQAGRAGGWEWDIESGRNLCFGEAHALLGTTPEAYSGWIQEFWDRVHPEDRARLHDALENAKLNNAEFNEEFRVVWPDGMVHWLRSQGRYLYAANAEPERMLGVSLDITERKRTEESLRQSEERFRLAAQAGKMFAYEWDAATDVIVRSAESVQILGIDEAAQTTGQQILTKVHPDDRERLMASVAELSPAKPRLQISYRMVRDDGTVIWVERNSRAHFDEQGRMLRIVGMVADITERKRAEEALRESEARFRLAAQAGKMYAYEWDVATDVAVRSEEYANILGLTGVPRFHTRQQFLSRVHPDDRAKFIAAVADLTPENPTTQISYRVLRPDGAVIWLEKSGRAFFDAQGRMLRMIGIVGDITERKLAEEVLASVSRRLIEAQEQERTRIARELHDDIGQRLALLAIALEQLQQNPPNLSEVRGRVGELWKQTSEIAADIQSLSHELHSSRLEYLGITAAMRAFCKEFGEQQKVEIDFKTHGLPTPVPPDISLCLFRVLQEALHNSAKHSGVRHFEVRLWGASGEIHLTVRDSGAGFDGKVAKERRGLGLISMEERLKLLNGAFSIESQPKRGTTIHARVPLSSESDSMRAAG